MDEIFRLIRLAFLPVPAALWTLLWPPWAIVVSCIVVPLRVGWTTVGRVCGYPFVFLGAALFAGRDAVDTYMRNWSESYQKTWDLLGVLDFTQGYRSLLAWWDDPRTEPLSGVVIGSNIVAALGVAAAVSETIRKILLIILAVVAGLIILGIICD
jgi:hypothetical protein